MEVTIGCARGTGVGLFTFGLGCWGGKMRSKQRKAHPMGREPELLGTIHVVYLIFTMCCFYGWRHWGPEGQGMHSCQGAETGSRPRFHDCKAICLAVAHLSHWEERMRILLAVTLHSSLPPYLSCSELTTSSVCKIWSLSKWCKSLRDYQTVVEVGIWGSKYHNT